MSEGEWVQVQRGRAGGSQGPGPKRPQAPKAEAARARACELAQALAESSGSGGTEAEAAAVSKLVARTHAWAAALRDGSIYRHLHSALQGLTATRRDVFVALSCLGLGNFASSPPALLQLALSVCLLQDLVTGGGGGGGRAVGDGEPTATAAPTAKAYCFDPSFTELERAACAALGFTVPSSAEPALLAMPLSGASDPQEPAAQSPPAGLLLFYLPHCPYGLYAQLLQRNWTRLPRVALVGNSFSSYGLRSLAPTLPPHLDGPRLLEARGAVSEAAWWAALHPASFHSSSAPSQQRAPALGGSAALGREMGAHLEAAFNDTSLHSFSFSSSTSPASPASSSASSSSASLTSRSASAPLGDGEGEVEALPPPCPSRDELDAVLQRLRDETDC